MSGDDVLSRSLGAYFDAFVHDERPDLEQRRRDFVLHATSHIVAAARLTDQFLDVFGQPRTKRRRRSPRKP